MEQQFKAMFDLRLLADCTANEIRGHWAMSEAIMAWTELEFETRSAVIQELMTRRYWRRENAMLRDMEYLINPAGGNLDVRG